MKKIIIVAAVLSIAFFSCKKSKIGNIDVPGGGTTDTIGTVYAAGYEVSATTLKNVAAYWRASTITRLTDGSKDAYATGIIKVGNDVYVCGYEANGTSTAIVKYWKNGTAVNLTDGTKAAYASAIVVMGADVYVAGHEFNAAGNPVAKYWKNGAVVNLTDGTKYASANSIVVVGADVYVAGYEYISSGASIAKYWKNGTAVNLSNGTTNYFANAIAVNGSDVYVAGSVSALSIYDLAFWKNGVLIHLPAALNAETNAVAVNLGSVYVGGSVGQRATYWKDGIAFPLENNLSTNEHINSIFVFAGKVYCGGYRSYFGSGSIACTWSFGGSTQLSTYASQVKSIYIVN